MDKYNISGLRVNHEALINQHLSQDYGDLRGDLMIDKLREEYKVLPNEALYVIDCKNAQLEPITPNFDRIIGIDGSHQNDLSTLYTHVSDLNYEALVRWVETMLDGIFSTWKDLLPEKDVLRCLYLTKDNRVLLKSTTALVFDSKGTMRYSLGKLADLTEIVPFQYFTYRFDGPNSKKVRETYQCKMKSVNVLSARETEIIRLIGAGNSSEQIAGDLFISRLTVDKHRRNIIEKLSVSSATAAFNRCKNLGYL